MENKQKIFYKIGIDEAGRGPLAGPVAVGIVLLPADFDWSLLPEVNDSKKLSEKKRELIYESAMRLAKSQQLFCTVEMGSASSIDKRGIAVVIRDCIDKGLKEIDNQIRYSHGIPVDFNNIQVLLDGSLKAPEYCVHQETIIKGDAKEKVIGLASILAKVTRDDYMRRRAKLAAYQLYHFARHKGYGTAAHRQAIAMNGLSSEHRKTFCKNIKIKGKKSANSG